MSRSAQALPAAGDEPDGPTSASRFENTVNIDPSWAIAYLNLSDALAKAGESERAKKVYQTYPELVSNGAGGGYVKAQWAKG